MFTNTSADRRMELPRRVSIGVVTQKIRRLACTSRLFRPGLQCPPFAERNCPRVVIFSPLILTGKIQNNGKESVNGSGVIAIGYQGHVYTAPAQDMMIDEASEGCFLAIERAPRGGLQ